MTSTEPGARVGTEVSRSAAPAVTRAVAVLELLEEARGVPLPLGEIARRLGVAKSSTSNICQALEEGALVVRVRGGYRLGRRTAELGGAYVAGFNRIQEFYTFCQESVVLQHEVVQVAMLHDRDAVYLATHEGRAAMRLTASIGSRFPAAPTALGNALLSTLTDEEIAERFTSDEHFPALTERSVRSLPDLLAKIARVRDGGHAIDDNEVHPGIFGVAMVLPPWASGEQPLAIGASLAAHALDEARSRVVVAELARAVELLSNPLYCPVAPALPSS